MYLNRLAIMQNALRRNKKYEMEKINGQQNSARKRRRKKSDSVNAVENKQWYAAVQWWCITTVSTII